MVMFFCPRCVMRVNVSKHNTDFVHACNSKIEAIDNEDVLVIGDATDFDGSHPIGTKKALLQGIENQIAGTRGGILGGDVEEKTNRGVSKNRWRTRRHFAYVDVNEQVEKKWQNKRNQNRA